MNGDLNLSGTPVPAAYGARVGALPATYRRAFVVLFAVTLFASSALMFVVEPLFGKLVLPRLGGSPSVWNTCVVFYQAVLLVGYLYTHLLTTRLGLRGQILLHVVLLAAASLTLPVGVRADWAPPAAGSPIPSLLGVLAIGVGAPLLVLSATAPLVQRWFSHTTHPSAGDPYHLYAASNVGSILALLAYPIVIEPTASLQSQSTFWSVGFVLLVVMTATCGVAAMRQRSDRRNDTRPVDAALQAVSWGRRARWIGLAFVPSSLMLAVTTYASTDIASVPLLWTVPLAVYLLTFVYAFAANRRRSLRLGHGAMVALTLPIAVAIALGASRPVSLMLPLHLALLLTFALTLHGELADDRPDAHHLTDFYLCLALGGVLGGVFNTVLAPMLFTSVAEYPIAIALAWLLRRRADSTGTAFRGTDLVFPLLTGAAAAALILCLKGALLPATTLPLILGALIVGYLGCIRSNTRLALAVAGIALAGSVVQPQRDELLLARRTFFGILRVWNVPDRAEHKLAHGTTSHGIQSTNEAQRRDPQAYYHPSGPIGQVFQAWEPSLGNARIGVVGLGAGGLAAYARPGQRWTFYEIDPEVERIARDTTLFTYLHDCGDTCQVVLGDARLSLDRNPAPGYRILIIDAFSSDAIPVHLLTREALDLYLSRISADGLLAFHISNRHLDLKPVLARLALERSLVATAQLYRSGTPDEAQTASEWVLVARSAATLGPLAADTRWTRLTSSGAERVWTDDFSNVFSVLKGLRGSTRS